MSVTQSWPPGLSKNRNKVATATQSWLPKSISNKRNQQRWSQAIHHQKPSMRQSSGSMSVRRAGHQACRRTETKWRALRRAGCQTQSATSETSSDGLRRSTTSKRRCRQIKRIDERYAELTARLDDEVKRLNDQQAALTSTIQEELRRINARTSEVTASIPSVQSRVADPIPTEARYAELAARTAAVERDLKAAVEERQPFVQPAVVAAIIAALLSILSAGAVAFFHRSRTVADNGPG